MSNTTTGFTGGEPMKIGDIISLGYEVVDLLDQCPTSLRGVHDALVEYMNQVFKKNKYKPSRSLQIDQFAVNIENK